MNVCIQLNIHIKMVYSYMIYVDIHTHIFYKKAILNIHKNILFFFYIPFMIVRTRHKASFVSYAYAKFTTNFELILCNICFSISTIDSPFRFFIRFFSSFLHAYIFPVARTYKSNQIKTFLFVMLFNLYI